MTDPSDAYTRARPVPEDNLVGDLTDRNAFTLDAIATAVVRRHAPWAWGRTAELGACWSSRSRTGTRYL